ncbi:hypothetical protein F2Q69_00040143 [Brassica cretica]|uniref:Uncharacterized protein n=1 Tax=Brassica cretica TaxID=69181 RepID=A0A8S9NGA5_BRACR|nr:hypothetical protein F2Q69_00040143 [Brassica cretica]
MLRRFRKEELWNRLQSHGGQEAVVLEGEVAVPVGGPEMIIGKERDYRKRSRRCSASPARRSRSPRSASPPKASHEMRRSKERSLTPLPRSRSPRSPSLEKASPERKRNDRFPSPRDKARSQSPYADVGMTAYLRRRHGDLSYYLVFVSCDRSLSKFIRVSLIHSSAKASEK